MDSKITRRAVLGTIIGGLAAAPFVTRYFMSGRKSLEYVKNDYSDLEINPEFYNLKTDLSKEELRDAIIVFLKERDKWREFKGMSGSILAESVVDPIEAEKEQVRYRIEGKYAFKLLDRTTPNERGAMWDYQMDYFDAKNSSANWSITTDGKLKNTKLSGQSSEKDISIFLGILMAFALPKEIFSSLTDDALAGLVGAWAPRSHLDAKTVAHSYVFKNSSGDSPLAEMYFENGHFSEFRKKENKTNKVSFVLFEEYSETNGVFFPERFVSCSQGIVHTIDLKNKKIMLV